MKRIVMAVIISAMMYAATAAVTTSCTWMDEVWSSFNREQQEEEPEIPMDQVLRVDQLLSGSFAGDTVWIRGVVVGGLRSDGSVDFSCDDAVVGTAVVLADDADCTDPDACMVLHLTKKAHKEALGLDQSGVKEKIFHQGIYAQGKVATHKGYPSLTNLCDYRLE